MTLSRRDLLAGMAMQGMLNGWPDISLMHEDARRAVMMADALIAELDKTSSPQS